MSQDRADPGFSTRQPGLSRRYFLVCEGRVGTTLGTFVAGQKLTFADNEFTLPCGTWTVRRGPTPARALFDVIIDVIVINPIETLHLSGHVVGAMTTSVRVFDCPPHQATKQAQPPGCP